MLFKSSKSQTVEIFHILFSLSHLTLKELQNFSFGYVFICRLRKFQNSEQT